MAASVREVPDALVSAPALTPADLSALAVSALRSLCYRRGILRPAPGRAPKDCTRDELVAALCGAPRPDGGIAASAPLGAGGLVDVLAGSVCASPVLREVIGAAVADAVAPFSERFAALAPVLVSLPELPAPVKLPPSCAAPVFSDLLECLRLGMPTMMVGPAGCGKGTMARQAAEALGLPFYMQAFGPGSREHHLTGRRLPDASGAWAYIGTEFVDAVEVGGLFLADELDAADPGVLLCFSDFLGSPSGLLKLPERHEARTARRSDAFRFVGVMNTFGNGADDLYTASGALDARTLDRFAGAVLHVDYNGPYEESLACSAPDGPALLSWVRDVRKRIADGRLRRTMSTRAIIAGCKLLSVGRSLADVKGRLLVGWSDDERNALGAAGRL